MANPLHATQAAQQKQINALAAEVSKLRDEMARNNNESSTKESVRQLREDLQKVDKARLADNERFKEALEKLGETIKKMPAVAMTDHGNLFGAVQFYNAAKARGCPPGDRLRGVRLAGRPQNPLAHRPL